MAKYRIIKSVSRDSYNPYFIQEWNPHTLSWELNYSSGYSTLRKAKQHVKERKGWDQSKETPAEVVWEEEDE